MESIYKRNIYDIAVNTFEVTCYMFPLEDWEIEDEDRTSVSTGDIRSVVEFHGAAKGAMVIAPSDDLLTAMAANMLGIEDPDKDQKSGALCEIANIICGNTVPLFAQNEEICYIEPPKILTNGEQPKRNEDKLNKESVEVLLDEGKVEITVTYSIGE